MEERRYGFLSTFVVAVILDVYVIMFRLHIIVSRLDSFIFWFS